MKVIAPPAQEEEAPSEPRKSPQTATDAPEGERSPTRAQRSPYRAARGGGVVYWPVRPRSAIGARKGLSTIVCLARERSRDGCGTLWSWTEGMRNQYPPSPKKLTSRASEGEVSPARSRRRKTLVDEPRSSCHQTPDVPLRYVVEGHLESARELLQRP
jgi:hypothetical protein